ncbi:MAG: hypothetical protein ACRBC3_02675, partial [Burkholderiaceae bacterium]
GVATRLASIATPRHPIPPARICDAVGLSLVGRWALRWGWYLTRFAQTGCQAIPNQASPRGLP